MVMIAHGGLGFRGDRKTASNIDIIISIIFLV
jgi:hypothetical protein